MKGLELFNNVLPQHGLLCIVGLMHDKSAPAIVKYFDQGSEDADEFIQEMDESGREVYFGCASYQDSSKKKDVRNIHTLRAFYVDLDCGKGDGGYETKQEAINDLNRFCSETRLPLPTLVDSGNGVHAYWPLTEAVEYNTWKPIADAFKKFVRQHELKADPVVSADGARILRVPGTINKKRVHKHRPVRLRHTVDAIDLETFTGLISYIPRGAYTAQTSDPVMEKLLKESNKYKFSRIYKKSIETIEREEEVEEEYEQIDGSKAFRLIKKKVTRSAGCPQIAYCVANSENLEEPMWTAALSIAWFCVDKIDGIEMVSRGYPGTGPEEWYDKASKRVGPYLCETWKGLEHPQLCGQCIHRGKISTPLVLGTVIEQATPEDNIIEVKHETLGETVTVELPNEYPFPWMRPKAGGVALRGKPDAQGSSNNNDDDDDDPDEVLVYEHDFWVKRRMWDGNKEMILMARHLPHDGLLEFSAPLSDVFKTEKLQALLSDKGITAAHHSRRLDLLKKYIAAWVSRLQKENSADKARSQFGWQDNDTVFVIGSREIDKNGDLKYSPIKSSLEKIADIYSKRGSLDEWRKIANYYAKPGNEARAFGLFCSFGAPLYKFIGEGSMIVHLTNAASGVGKSSIQKVALSVWGDPLRALLTENDTPNAKINRAGILHNILCAIDEITNMLPEAASRFSFDLSAGRGKNRLKSGDNEERENNTTWETIFLTSGNNSLHDTLRQHKAQVEGEMYRIFEAPVPIDRSLTKAEADEIYAYTLPHNYGHAGEEFMRYVVPNKQDVIERLREIQAQYDEMIGAESKERFYSACFAAAFAGAEIANRLGLIDIPIEPVMKWASGLLDDTRVVLKKAVTISDEANYEAVISEYWNQTIAQILVVQSGETETDENLLNQQSLKPVIGALKGRHEVKTKRLYLAVADFEKWLRLNRVPSHQVVEALKSKGVLDKEEFFNLGYDTSAYNTAPVRTYRFNTAKLTSPD
jgi:hypothetical protein